jgi:hypothetical protein
MIEFTRVTFGVSVASPYGASARAGELKAMVLLMSVSVSAKNSGCRRRLVLPHRHALERERAVGQDAAGGEAVAVLDGQIPQVRAVENAHDEHATATTNGDASVSRSFDRHERRECDRRVDDDGVTSERRREADDVAHVGLTDGPPQRASRLVARLVGDHERVLRDDAHRGPEPDRGRG